MTKYVSYFLCRNATAAASRVADIRLYRIFLCTVGLFSGPVGRSVKRRERACATGRNLLHKGTVNYGRGVMTRSLEKSWVHRYRIRTATAVPTALLRTFSGAGRQYFIRAVYVHLILERQRSNYCNPSRSSFEPNWSRLCQRLNWPFITAIKTRFYIMTFSRTLTFWFVPCHLLDFAARILFSLPVCPSAPPLLSLFLS